MSKGWKQKLNILDKRIEKVNEWIDDGCNMEPFRDGIVRQRVDLVSKIGKRQEVIKKS